MVLSDKSIREELKGGGIVIDPLEEGALQPSSVDVRVDRYFRVFRNDTTPYIDPKRSQEDLTELVEVADGDAFILHPGEFVLGSTLERVALGSDLVGRLEGKSSLGRLGLLIHSSLPASEPVMVLASGGLQPRPIGEVVTHRLQGAVVSFDPETFEVGYHEITGWYEGPPDRIYEVRLASGRRVRVTAGHNLFTIDQHGRLTKTRTAELTRGARVAVPRAVPDPPSASPHIDLLSFIPREVRNSLTCSGPTVAKAFGRSPKEVDRFLSEGGFRNGDYYRSRSRLPLTVATRLPGLLERLGPDDRIGGRGTRHGLPPSIPVDHEIAWLLGMYVAEGSRRRNQFTISNSAHSKRIPPIVFGWSRPLLRSFLSGLVDGDGSRDPTRTSVWTCSDGLAADVLLLAERLGVRAGSSLRRRGRSQLWQIYMPANEHKLLTSVPLPDRLLVEIRERAGLDQLTASRLAGYRHPADLCNIENRSGREAVRLATLRRLRTVYARRPECRRSLTRLDRLVDGDLLWDTVVEVRDTGSVEPIYDLEVRPNGRKVENFLAGSGGVFVSNTAGFVDAGWDGHLTLELSNVANLPIAIYPGMKIGQISFLRMSSEAEEPYGAEAKASKYQGQRGPTPSRYYLNFPERGRDEADPSRDK